MTRGGVECGPGRARPRGVSLAGPGRKRGILPPSTGGKLWGKPVSK